MPATPFLGNPLLGLNIVAILDLCKGFDRARRGSWPLFCYVQPLKQYKVPELAKKSSMKAVASGYEHVLSMGDKLGDYVDEWIAVVDGQVVSRGKSAKQVYEEAKKYDESKVPYIMKVPTEKIVVL